MHDLISKEAAIDAIKSSRSLVDAMEKVIKLPSAEPEIVRCKDCKHRGSYWGNCRLLEKKYHQGVLVDGDNFCSKAERRTDDGD